MTLALILAGFAGLLIGGDLLVRGAVGIAQRLAVSPLVIGLTLVGFGTSTPELVTSVQAALIDAPGIAVGNVVGSNIANILLIMGIAAVIHPVAASRAAFRRDGTALVIATLLCVGIALAGSITRWAGAGLVVLLAGYVAIAFFSERGSQATGAGTLPAGTRVDKAEQRGLPRLFATFLGGLVLTLVGARFLVDGSVELARIAGISESIIGLTIVAVGTSLPELVTSAVAARRGEGDVAFGNIVGSNLFNILGILGTTALVAPIAVPAEIARFDIWIMLGATAALIGATVTGWRICRWEGALLLLAYAGYLLAIFVSLPAT